MDELVENACVPVAFVCSPFAAKLEETGSVAVTITSTDPIPLNGLTDAVERCGLGGSAACCDGCASSEDSVALAADCSPASSLAGAVTATVEIAAAVPTLAESVSGAASNDRVPVAKTSGAAGV